VSVPEAAEHVGESLERDLFGAEGGFGPGIDRFPSVEAGEVVAERLALLPETSGEEAEEGVAVGQAQVVGARFEQHHGGIDFGGG